MRSARGTTLGDLIALLTNDHWSEEPAREDGPPCRHFAHPRKPGVIVLCGDIDDVIAPETVRSVLTRAQMR